MFSFFPVKHFNVVKWNIHWLGTHRKKLTRYLQVGIFDISGDLTFCILLSLGPSRHEAKNIGLSMKKTKVKKKEGKHCTTRIHFMH